MAGRAPRKIPRRGRRRPRRTKKERLKMRIAKGLEALNTLPEKVLSLTEQTTLRRIQDIHNGTVVGPTLKETDYINLKRIAANHGLRL